MSTGISWPTIGGDPYEIPASGEVNWAELSEYLIALAQAQTTTAQKVAARIATTSPVTIGSASDYLVSAKMAVPGPVTINLPAGVLGQSFALGDGTGDAATNNITIVPNATDTIAGLATYVLNQDGASVQIVFSGAGNWTITAQAAGEGGGGGVSRNAIDAGTPAWVVYNNAVTGLLAEEQYLNASRGGLGINASASNGVVKFTAGVASVSPIANSDLGSGIDAAKIGSGTVSNAEFNFLDTVTSNIQTQLNAKQASGAYITGLTGDVVATGPGSVTSTIQSSVIVDSMISGSAAIAYSKLAALTTSRALASDGSGKIATANTTLLELNFVNGVTSLIQPQLDGKVAGPAASVDSEIMLFSGITGKVAKRSTLTGVAKLTTGVISVSAVDLSTIEVTGTLPIARGGTGQVTRQTALDGLLPTQTGLAGQVLTTNGSTAAWAAGGSGGGYTVSVITANPAPAVANTQYLANTTGAAFSITLPAGVTGTKIKIQDDRGTWDSNNLTIIPATGERIWPLAINVSLVCNVIRGWIELVYDGAGWSPNSLASTTLGSGSGLVGVAVSTTVALATNGVMYEADTTSAGFTITLPGGTSAAVVGVLDAGLKFGTNNLILAPATGQSLDDGAANDTITMDVTRGNIIVYRANGASVWKSQVGSLTRYAGGSIPGSTTGLAQTGAIGELFGTQRAGTGGSVYTDFTTTGWSATPTSVVQRTLNIGIYLVSYSVQTVQSTGAYAAYSSLFIGGVEVDGTNGRQFRDSANGGFTTMADAKPISITSNATLVSIVTAISGFVGTSTGSRNTLTIVRIA